MASWIVHLRVADCIFDSISAEPVYFAAGNIAPDCGKKLSNRNFIPTTAETHFTKTDKGACEYSDFYEKFICNETDFQRYSFFMGYYTHLITDVLWTHLVNIPQRVKFSKLLESQGETQFYRKMKSEWYGLDFVYLKKNPDMRMWKIFCSIDEFPNEYFDFYSYDAFTKRFHEIMGFYGSAAETKDRYFKYLKPEECTNFVNSASNKILAELKKMKGEE